MHRAKYSQIGLWSIPLTALLLALNAPLWLGFLISKSSLERIAVASIGRQHSLAAYDYADVRRWAGVYRIEGVAGGRWPGGPDEPTELFVENYPFFAGSSEFVYSPRAVPPHYDVSFGGGWYALRSYGSWIG